MSVDVSENVFAFSLLYCPQHRNTLHTKCAARHSATRAMQIGGMATAQKENVFAAEKLEMSNVENFLE